MENGLKIARELCIPWSPDQTTSRILEYVESSTNEELNSCLIKISEEIASGDRLPASWSLLHFQEGDRVEITKLSYINQLLLQNLAGWQGHVLKWKPSLGLLKIRWSDGWISNSMTSMGDEFINHGKSDIPGPPEYHFDREAS